MRKQIKVRLINDTERIFWLIPMPVSQFCEIEVAPGYCFAVHRPVKIEAETVVIENTGWVLSEAESGLRITSLNGTRADLIEKGAETLARAKAFIGRDDYIGIAMRQVSAKTEQYEERFPKA